MSSKKKYLQASIKFLDPSLDGGSLVEISRFYRPLLRLHDDHLTSCFFEAIGDGFGNMELNTPYRVSIIFPSWSQMEEYYGISIEEMFPIGRSIEIVATPCKIVATGQVEGVFEANAI